MFDKIIIIILSIGVIYFMYNFKNNNIENFNQDDCAELQNSNCYESDGNWCSNPNFSKTDKGIWQCANCSLCRARGGTAPLPSTNNNSQSTNNNFQENLSGLDAKTFTAIKQEINRQYNMDIEAIRNLGSISKSLLTGKNYHSTNTATPGTLTIPSNTIIEGWAVAMPIGGIMLWTKSTPPPPNTTGFKLSGFTLAGADKWAPCNGENGTPDLRNRFPIGQGDWNKSLKSLIGGNVPTRNHIHAIGNDGNHQHNVQIRRHDEGHMGSQNMTRSFRGGAFTDRSANMNFNHGIPIHHAGAHSHGGKTGHSARTDNQNHAHPYRQDNYDHATVPYSTVIQFWMRVR